MASSFTFERRVAVRAATLLLFLAFSLNGEDRATYWTQAQAALKSADYAAAESLYRKFLKIDPSTAEAHANLGLALHMRKKPKEAVESFRAAIRLNPALAHAYLFLGIDLFNLNDTTAASSALKQYTSLAPHDPQGFYYQGLSFAARREYVRAMESLENAARLAPRDVDILYHLAQSYIAEANAIARRVAEYDPKLPLLREWEQKQAARMEALIRQTPLSTVEKSTLRALQARLGRTPPDLEAEQRAAAAYADLYLQTTRRFCEIEPNSFRIRQLLAAYYEKTGQTDKAIGQLNLAIQQNPNVRGLHLALGSIYKDSSRPELAAEQFEQELKLGSPDPEARLQLAQAYLLLQRPNEALAELVAAKEMHGEQSGALWKSFAKAYTQMGDHEKAAASYEQALALGQGDRALYYQLGQTYRRLGKTEQARKMFAATTEAAQAELDRQEARRSHAVEAQAKEKPVKGKVAAQ